MADDADFLRAIIDDPDDDGPRLIYADWLEERGDPRGGSSSGCSARSARMDDGDKL